MTEGFDALKAKVDAQGRILLEYKRRSWNDNDKRFVALNWAITLNDELAKMLDQSSSTTITKEGIRFVKNHLNATSDWLKAIDSKDDHDHLG